MLNIIFYQGVKIVNNMGTLNATLTHILHSWKKNTWSMLNVGIAINVGISKKIAQIMINGKFHRISMILTLKYGPIMINKETMTVHSHLAHNHQIIEE